MRKHALGSTRPSRGWCESFKPERPNRCRDADATAVGERDADVDVVTERKSAVSACRFPTWKGGKRMERLRHYFHEDMACLLEADPDVFRWSAQVEPLEVEFDDGQVREYPHVMWAQTARGMRHISLHHGSRRPDAHAEPERRPKPVEVRGKVFESYTRADLAAHPRLRSSKDVLFHRSRDLEPELVMRVAAMWAEAPASTLGELHRRLGQDVVPWEDVVCLVAQGFAVVDLDCPVGPSMPLVSCNLHRHLR